MRKSLIRLLKVGLVAAFIVSLAGVSAAFEPKRPATDRVFDNKIENLIKRISVLPPSEVFEALKGVEFLGEDDLIAKTLHRSFQHRRNDGIDHSIKILSLPQRERINGSEVHRAMDLYIGKKIFEVFPEESVPKLLKLYETGNAVTRGNVLRASGNIVGPEISSLLVNALDDKAFCDSEDPEIEGPPLRICDVAYNQLVLRYRIKNVLRTIGPIYRLENREYHITVLKSRL